MDESNDAKLARAQARQANIDRLYRQAKSFADSAATIREQLEALRRDDPVKYQLKAVEREADIARAIERSEQLTREAEAAQRYMFERTIPEPELPESLRIPKEWRRDKDRQRDEDDGRGL